MSETETDYTKPIDVLAALAQVITNKNPMRLHGIEHAQIDAAEMILQLTKHSDREVREEALVFLRAVALGHGEGGRTAQVRALEVMMKEGVS